VIGALLVANRGEIARRIFRTCRGLGVRTIAVYSDADASAAHVRDADAAVRLGPPPPRQSYLDAEAILAAARRSGADAIHPGYGFLSENAEFAEAVEAAGLIWVGPPAAAIRAMGLKDAAKRLMQEAGVPVTPGYLGEDQGRLAKEAEAIGWPVLIKAVAGGGGKGMRKVERGEDFPAALESARREAAAAFGDDRVLLEKYITRPRHIEVQVFADAHGGCVHLFERDCSLQRRHQKVIEEAPAPGMDSPTREALCAAAVRAAKAVNYRGAGTMEFIADASDGLRADRIWFMEMNTRLQVEHPVTEAITGVDLVEWQLRVAAGEPLPLTQAEIACEGWAMEARLYAEDPCTGFLPSVGRLEVFDLPDGVRCDSAVEAGDAVSPFYDPMLAKLIAHDETREAARARLENACQAVRAWPVKTNAAFLARCLAEPTFKAGEADTGFIEARLDTLTAPSPAGEAAAGQAAWAFVEQARTWPAGLDGFRLNRASEPCVTLHGADGADIRAQARASGLMSRPGGQETQVVFDAGAAFAFRLYPEPGIGRAATADGAIVSPMPGRIVSIARQAGDTVVAGEVLVTLEAMKMEHGLKAPFDGAVAEIHVAEGQQVAEGVVLARLTPKT
jgi:propionyl-CoA carboxylase alpha chain/3-methylcrotonyl-CoA carboxylase alpha subunit